MKVLWLALLVAAVLGIAVLYDQQAHAYTPPLSEKVGIIISVNGPLCDAKRPVSLTIINNSDKKISYTEIEVEVKESGHSSTLEYETFDTDKIIEPLGNYSICARRPRRLGHEADNETYSKYPYLQYSARVISASSY